MKRIQVEDGVHESFRQLQGNDETRKLKKLVELGERRQNEIALVVLEDVLMHFGANRGQVSVAPFFDGLSRFFDDIRIYRLNFYDGSSFCKALEKAMTVTEARVILYIGAHGSKGRISGANARTVAASIAQSAKDKLEGVILSACQTAGTDETLETLLKGRANWVFGYSNSVNILSSMLLETAVLRQVFGAESDYINTEDGIVATFGKALGCFSPSWDFGDDAMPSSVRLQVRPKHKQLSSDVTPELVKKAWAAPKKKPKRQPKASS